MGKRTRRKFRGTDPSEAARRAYEQRRNPALWGVNDEAMALPSNADVGSTDATREKTRRVQRFDVFATIKLSDHQFNAVRRYQVDLAESYGVGDRDTAAEKVDGSGGSRDLATARMMAAARRCDEVCELLSHADRRLLDDLSKPTWVQGKAINWKATVKRLRGLIDRDAAASCIKQLAENVRLAYAEIDGQGVRRAA